MLIKVMVDVKLSEYATIIDYKKVD